MLMKKLFKQKPVFCLLGILLILAVSACAYIFLAGDEYHFTHDLYNTDTLDVQNAACEVTNGNIEVYDLHITDNVLHMTVRSLKPGKDFVTVTIPSEAEEDYRFYGSFSVTHGGLVVYRNTLDFTGSRFAAFTALLSFLIIAAAMLSSYDRYRRFGEFSYTMIVRGGLGQFFMLQAVLLALRLPGMKYFSGLLSTISGAGAILSLMLVPLMLILAAAVSVSNLSLIRHEGFRIPNMLGIIFSIMWIIGTILTLAVGLNASGSVDEVAFITSINTIIAYAVFYFECMLFATILSSILAVKHKPPYDRDYIIILGCSILPDGRLTPILRARADAALKFERDQFEATGKHAVFVPSGGQGEDEVISESEAMSRYLTQNGTPPERILLENRSVNTFENMKFSKEAIEKHCQIDSCNVAFATTNYHVFRSYTLARKNKMMVQGISAKTKWYFFPNAFLREFVGLIVEEIPHHIVMLLLILVFSVIVNVLSFI